VHWMIYQIGDIRREIILCIDVHVRTLCLWRQRFYGNDNGKDQLHSALSATVDWQSKSVTTQLPGTVNPHFMLPYNTLSFLSEINMFEMNIFYAAVPCVCLLQCAVSEINGLHVISSCSYPVFVCHSVTISNNCLSCYSWWKTKLPDYVVVGRVLNLRAFQFHWF